MHNWIYFMKKKHWSRWIPVFFLLLCHFSLVLSLAWQKAPTADEYSYIATGYLYWTDWDFRLDRTHPPLMRVLIGLPLQFTEIHMPDLQREKWDTRESYFLGYPIGWEMLLGGVNPLKKIVFLSRLPIGILSTGLACLLFLWARQLYGYAGGMVALFLYCFSPNIMAHAGLATMDVGLCFFFLLFLFLLYRYMRYPTNPRLILAGTSLGAALLAKATALLLIPIAIGALIWVVCKEKRLTDREKIPSCIQQAFVLFGSGWIFMLLIYGFPFRPFFYGDTLANVFTKSLKMGEMGADVPGMPHMNYAFYLCGEYSTEGWFYYFLAAILFKTPIAVLGCLGVVMACAKPRWHGIADGLIVGSIGLLLLASMFNRVNIGIRHVLPFYPLLFLYLGRMALIPHFSWKIASCFFGCWLLYASLGTYPHQLPYFNELAGGPSHGHYYLDDSNIDWGQDLNRLKNVQEEFPNTPLFVATNWMFNPAIFQLKVERLQNEDISRPPKGIVAVGKHWAIRHRVHRWSSHYFDWFEKYEPIGHVGHSILLYRFE